MNKTMTDAQFQLLATLCDIEGNYKSSSLCEFSEKKLLPREIDNIIDVIFREFLMHGIEESFEPNAYGVDLEALLDAINRRRLRNS